jgi:hypothetical protein
VIFLGAVVEGAVLRDKLGESIGGSYAFWVSVRMHKSFCASNVRTAPGKHKKKKREKKKKSKVK